MRKFVFFISCAAAFFRALTAQEPLLSVGDKNMDAIARDGNVLALQLYRLLKEGKENLVFSPYAVVESMALPFLGSEGATRAQMARILGFRAQPPAVYQAFRGLNERMSDSPYFLTSSLWIQKGSVRPEFQSATEKKGHASLRFVDFATRPEAARTEMNNWMRERSQGKIIDIVPPAELSKVTSMVVLSGAYMKGRFKQAFNFHSTMQTPFFSERHSTSTVPTMSSTGEYGYLHEKQFSVVEIPYDARRSSFSRLSLLVVLPHETYGLKSIENDLTIEEVQRWLKDIHKQLVVVSLPRFRVTGFFSLVNTFSKLALGDPFRDSANFTDIREGGSLKISKVFHRAVYAVDEAGSESGLASGLENDSRRDSQVAITFAANHPFLFMVVDRSSGAILLMGRLLSL